MSMKSFAGLFSEHVEIACRAAALRGATRAAIDAAETRGTITALSQALRAHLIAEARAVYRRLLACRDRGVAETARAARRSFATLAYDWRRYVARWTPEAIDADPAGFAAATEALLDRLDARIVFENEKLYPLALGLADLPLRSHPAPAAAAA
jgi:hypothetical protein